MLENGFLDRILDNGSANGLEEGATDRVQTAVARPSSLRAAATNGHNGRKKSRTLAVLCFEKPDTFVGRYAGQLALALADRHTTVHLFTRQALEFYHPGVYVHALGECPASSVLDQVHEFTRRACNAFLRQFGGDAAGIPALGLEWSSIPALSLLGGGKGVPALLSLHSLERQRSGLNGEVARQIDGIEADGLREARAILTHDATTTEAAIELLPDCTDRLVAAPWTFPAHEFADNLDPGAIKARYQIGPVDPLILYVGDMEERHAPDVLMKAVAPVLKKHAQARFLFAGDGDLVWPLRVHARYALLERAVRLPGSIEGRELRELIQAADIVCVPSRVQTEWWPVLAGWAARRPVLASHEMAAGLALRHEEDSVLIDPHPASCAWGVDHLLGNVELLQSVARRGHERLEERFGWASVAAKIEEIMPLQ